MSQAAVKQSGCPSPSPPVVPFGAVQKSAGGFGFLVVHLWLLILCINVQPAWNGVITVFQPLITCNSACQAAIVISLICPLHSRPCQVSTPGNPSRSTKSKPLRRTLPQPWTMW